MCRSPFLPNGIPGVVSASGVVFFSYVGFDAVSTLSEEVKNPQRDLPIGNVECISWIYCVLYKTDKISPFTYDILGIIGTLFASSLLYVGVTLVLTGKS